ncbi:MAG: ATP-binding cassette domain-containing protein [Rhodospirillaceae bacterium]
MTLRLEAVTLSAPGAPRETPLFAPLSLSIAPGEVVTVMGPSGCGKSSLLDFLCGTLPGRFTPQGAAFLDDQPLAGLPPERRRLGILFQDDLLFPHLSVGDNLAFGLPRDAAGSRSRADRRALIENALAQAGLEGLAERHPATLSGGQRARASVLRVLLSKPRALLLDEPFSKLDADLRMRFRDFVFDHAAEAGLPCLLVTHDPEDARGRIISLEQHG